MLAALVALLGAQPSVTSYVGTSTKRIYASYAPQGISKLSGNAAHVVLTQMRTDENPALDGTGSLRFVEIDIDVFSRTFASAQALSDVVRLFLDDYSGAAGGETIGAVIMNGTRSDYLPPIDASQAGWHSFTTNMTVQYTES